MKSSPPFEKVIEEFKIYVSEKASFWNLIIFYVLVTVMLLPISIRNKNELIKDYSEQTFHTKSSLLNVLATTWLIWGAIIFTHYGIFVIWLISLFLLFLVFMHCFISTLTTNFWPMWMLFVKYFCIRSIYYIYPSVILLISDKLYRNAGLVIFALSYSLAMLFGIFSGAVEKAVGDWGVRTFGATVAKLGMLIPCLIAGRFAWKL